ncbi:hypothetical protein, partial [Salmonella enterica]|uniref:hypothetical protein n=1 Tax=Salmonella enterica TaxID=28901 RepID=UPI0020C3A1C4
MGFSQSHVGVHAGSAIDMWQTTIEIVQRAGGDPGHPGVYGTTEAPKPIKPKRLAVFESEGWPRLDASSREAFENALSAIAAQG